MIEKTRRATPGGRSNEQSDVRLALRPGQASIGRCWRRRMVFFGWWQQFRGRAAVAVHHGHGVCRSRGGGRDLRGPLERRTRTTATVGGAGRDFPAPGRLRPDPLSQSTVPRLRLCANVDPILAGFRRPIGLASYAARGVDVGRLGALADGGRIRAARPACFLPRVAGHRDRGMGALEYHRPGARPVAGEPPIRLEILHRHVDYRDEFIALRRGSGFALAAVPRAGGGGPGCFACRCHRHVPARCSWDPRFKGSICRAAGERQSRAPVPGDRRSDPASLHPMAPSSLLECTELADILDSRLLQPWLPAALRTSVAARPSSPITGTQAPGPITLAVRSLMKAGAVLFFGGCGILGWCAFRGRSDRCRAVPHPRQDSPRA